MPVMEELERMSEERFLALYEALEQRGFGPLDGEVAKVLNFRPHAIRKLPMAQRARRAKLLLERSKNAELAYELFGTYLMKTKKDLITRFLDATGVEHEEGMIADIEASRPDAGKLGDAVETLDRDFGREDVTLYLSMCAEQWPAVTEVGALWRTR